MKTLINWLLENRFNFKTVTMTDGSRGIMIDTDYNGMYPTKEVFAIHNMINNRCRRIKNLKLEQRGEYTALLVTELK